MRCIECYWSSLNTVGGSARVCCNKDSDHYNRVLSKEDAERDGCDSGESEQAVDYRRLNAWEFAKKYYM